MCNVQCAVRSLQRTLQFWQLLPSLRGRGLAVVAAVAVVAGLSKTWSTAQSRSSKIQQESPGPFASFPTNIFVPALN